MATDAHLHLTVGVDRDDPADRAVLRREVLAQLRALEGHSDAEHAHDLADRALLSLIHDREIEAAYDAVKRWYA